MRRLTSAATGAALVVLVTGCADEIVRGLEHDGEIDSYDAIGPDDVWTSEYSVNDGDAYIRFDGEQMEPEVRYGGEDLENGITEAATTAGYQDTP